MLTARCELTECDGLHRRKIRWWEWLIFAAVLPFYLPMALRGLCYYIWIHRQGKR